MYWSNNGVIFIINKKSNKNDKRNALNFSKTNNYKLRNAIR